jgi:hypothetical protein
VAPNGTGDAANNAPHQISLTDDERRREQHLAIRRLLTSFCEADSEEQRETWDFLKRALDEDRPADYKLFP